MTYRVEDLADRCGVSVDTIRYYQSIELLDPPARVGRNAFYDDHHVEALSRIRELKADGFTLAMVRRALSGQLDAGETALAAAISRPDPSPDHPAGPGAMATLEDLSAHTGVSPTVLQSVARQGILIAPESDGIPYGEADAEAVLAGQALLDAGVPISELLALAREHQAAIGGIAEQAVDLFARFVRDPIRAREPDEDAAATEMVEALQVMLPAATSIIAHTFRRQLLTAARVRIEADDAGPGGGDPSEGDPGGGDPAPGAP